MFVDSPEDWCVTLPDFCNLGGVNTSGGSRGVGGQNLDEKEEITEGGTAGQAKQNHLSPSPLSKLMVWIRH